MKQKMITLLIISAILLSSCGKQSETVENIDSINSGLEMQTVTESVESSEVSEDTEVSESMENAGAREEVAETKPVQEEIPEEAFDLSDKSPMEALRAVLLNEAPFIYNYTRSSTEHGTTWEVKRGYFDDVLDDVLLDLYVTEFGIVDLDGDQVPEVVLGVGNKLEIIVLRYQAGKVVSNIFSYRSMIDIREDGSFWQSGGASESYMSKLFFVGDSTFDDTIVEMDTRFEALYYVHDVPVSEEEMQKVYNAHEETAGIAWYEFTEEEIGKWVVDEAEPVDYNAATKEKQDYLDSFFYLLELRRSNVLMEQEKYNNDAKSYYYNCKSEMEGIYELYNEKLSGEELEQLEADQQRWQNGIDQRLVKSLYTSQAYSIEELERWSLYYYQGDYYLARACHLVNWYYGCQFYN